MTVGGGGETTVAEVDDLEIRNCGIGDFVFLTPYLNQLSRFPRRGGEFWQGGVRCFPNLLTVRFFFLIVIIPIIWDMC